MCEEYRVIVVVKKYNHDATTSIRTALWEFLGQLDYIEYNETLQAIQAAADVEDVGIEEDFVKNLSRKIWEANGGFCRAEIDMIHTEEIDNQYKPDKNAYSKLMAGKDCELACWEY